MRSKGCASVMTLLLASIETSPHTASLLLLVTFCKDLVLWNGTVEDIACGGARKDSEGQSVTEVSEKFREPRGAQLGACRSQYIRGNIFPQEHTPRRQRWSTLSPDWQQRDLIIVNEARVAGALRKRRRPGRLVERSRPLSPWRVTELPPRIHVIRRARL